VVKVISHNSALLAHMDGSVVFTRWHQCGPHIQRAKMVAMVTSVRCRVSAVSAFCWLTTQIPFITNCLVAVIHTKPVNSVFTQSLLPWQWPLDTCSCLCLRQIAWPRKPTPRIKQRVAGYHTTKVIAHKANYSKFCPKIGCHRNIPQYRWTPV